MRIICNNTGRLLESRARTRAMYVCVCHGLSERQLRQAVRDGAQSFEALQASTGVATCCRTCEPCAREVLHQTLDSAHATQQAA